MNIIEAADAMNSGMRVRRSCWEEEDYIYTLRHRILDADGSITKFATFELLADDWEVANDSSV